MRPRATPQLPSTVLARGCPWGRGCLRHYQAEVKTPGTCSILPFLFRPSSCPLANSLSHDFKITQILAPSHHPHCYSPSRGCHGPGPVCHSSGLVSLGLPYPSLPPISCSNQKPFCKPMVNSLLCSKPSEDSPSHLKSNSESFKETTHTSLSFLVPSLFSPPTPSTPATMTSCHRTFATAVPSTWDTFPPVFLTAAFLPTSRTWSQCHLLVEPFPDPTMQIQTTANPIPIPFSFTAARTITKHTAYLVCYCTFLSLQEGRALSLFCLFCCYFPSS